MQVFVRDLAQKMQEQAHNAGNGLTPVELKKTVLATSELKFLLEKVDAIDESAAKYHKPARGKKRPLKTDAKKPSKKKAKLVSLPSKAVASAAIATQAGRARTRTDETQMKPKQGSCTTLMPPSSKTTVEVEEDDDYDESDSD